MEAAIQSLNWVLGAADPVTNFVPMASVFLEIFGLQVASNYGTQKTEMAPSAFWNGAQKHVKVWYATQLASLDGGQ
jgi:hypothetical protein